MQLVLTANGPADVWLNGEHIHRHVHFHHQIPQSVSFQAEFQAGTNELIVRFAAVAIRECPYVLALRLLGQDTSDLQVRLPTKLLPLARRVQLERTMAGAYLTQDVFSRDDILELWWSDELKSAGELHARVQAKNGRIYAEGTINPQGGARIGLGQVVQLPDGAYDLILMPKPEEFYVHGMRVQRVVRRVPAGVRLVVTDVQALHRAQRLQYRADEPVVLVPQRADVPGTRDLSHQRREAVDGNEGRHHAAGQHRVEPGVYRGMVGPVDVLHPPLAVLGRQADVARHLDAVAFDREGGGMVQAAVAVHHQSGPAAQDCRGIQCARQAAGQFGRADVPGDVLEGVRFGNAQRAQPRREGPAGVVADQQQRGGAFRVDKIEGVVWIRSHLRPC